MLSENRPIDNYATLSCILRLGLKELEATLDTPYTTREMKFLTQVCIYEYVRI
jgi:hypothetical protein